MSDKTYEIPAGSPSERIIEVASDLFFNQGYRATGINEVISKSGVAKATFYSHFKSKDELCCAYLKASSQDAVVMMEQSIANARTPLTKFLAPMRTMEAMMIETEFRGCAFMNIASEVPDCGSPLRKEGIELYKMIGRRLIELSKALVESDPGKYGALNPVQLGKHYDVIMAGALALAELYAAVWPLQQGLKTLQALIGDDSK